MPISKALIRGVLGAVNHFTARLYVFIRTDRCRLPTIPRDFVFTVSDAARLRAH